MTDLFGDIYSVHRGLVASVVHQIVGALSESPLDAATVGSFVSWAALEHAFRLI